MREQYNRILRQFFYERLIRVRYERHLTQAQMAGILAMEERSYVELDHGKNCCSSLTLVRFLIYCCDDPVAFLKDLRAAFEREADNVA